MKLDKIAFGKVLAYISGIVQRNSLDTMDVEILDNLIDIEVPGPAVVDNYPKNENVERLMKVMAEGKYKIEAIKEHRAITGMGLKESKDAVERYWPNVKAVGFTKGELMTKLNENAPKDQSDFDVIADFINSL